MKNNLLKTIAAVAMLIVPLPLLLMLDSAAFKEPSILRYLFYYLASIPAIVAGYLLKKFKTAQTKPKKILLSNFLILLTLILIAVTTCICVNKIEEASDFSFNGAQVIFALIPALSFWFMLGMKLNKRSFSDVYTPLWLCIFIVETFLCYGFGFFIKEDHPPMATAQSVMVYLLIIMSLIVALLINQSNIETQINQRKNTNLIVPKGLKSHNAKLIIIVGAVILVAMLFRNLIASVTWWIIQTTLRLIDAILQLIKMETSAQITPEGEVPTSPLIGVQNNGPDFTVFIITLIVIVLVIVFRHKIFDFIKTLAMRFIGKFSVNEEESFNDSNYVDYYEPIIQQTEIANPETENDCLKRYKKEKDHTEKYRLGYRLYMMWLAKRNRNMSDKLTVEQQKLVAKKTYHGDSDIDNISDCYTEIRYNDGKADSEELSTMDVLVKELYR